MVPRSWISGRANQSRGLSDGVGSDPSASSSTRSRGRHHCTTARAAASLLLALGLLAGTAAARSGGVRPIVFPVLGAAHYTDDFGDARAGGRHRGIDIVAAKRSLALAAEAGKITFWKTSAAAGCMLYLHGASGTTYYYIHLNNDLSRKNDNRGKCVPGTAYAPGLRDGAKVVAGQPVGFVGDSGDADGGHAHLHFEVHPAGAAAVDGFPYLKAAQHLLFAAAPGAPFTLELAGTVTKPAAETLQMTVNDVRAWPMGQHQTRLRRALVLSVPATAVVQSVSGPRARNASLTNALKGQAVKVWTTPDTAKLKSERGDALALEAALVLLKKS